LRFEVKILAKLQFEKDFEKRKAKEKQIFLKFFELQQQKAPQTDYLQDLKVV